MAVIHTEHDPPEAVEIILSSTCNKTEMSEVSLSWSIRNTHNLKLNYTFKFFSIMGTIKEVTATSPRITVSLLYNVNYTINATAANCAGIGPASFFDINLLSVQILQVSWTLMFSLSLFLCMKTRLFSIIAYHT